jgi:hypothetical protein
MCEIHVRGCQWPKSRLPKAYLSESVVNPACTWGLAVTYISSSQVTKSKFRTCQYTARMQRTSNKHNQAVLFSGRWNRKGIAKTIIGYSRRIGPQKFVFGSNWRVRRRAVEVVRAVEDAPGIDSTKSSEFDGINTRSIALN